jgi:hypothetical protein
MRTKEMMSAAGVTLAGLGVLVGLAIGSGRNTPKLVAQRTQPVEVRTEVVRKTVNVYRRAHPHHVTGGPGGGPGGAGTPGRPGAPSSGVSARARTRSSGTSAVAPSSAAVPVVRTASSGSKASSGSGTRSSAITPVKTRTSGGSAGGASGSSKTVSTRSSGGHGEHDGGGHDD